jgi:primosomal protein N'
VTPDVEVGLACPHCAELWLRPTNLPGRLRCVSCLHRYELRSVCPDCGEHATIVRMANKVTSGTTTCVHCGASMLCPV